MGGPLWTEAEEDYFWETIVPNSDKKLGYTKAQKAQILSWEQLAEEMREAMRVKFEQLGKEVPRNYTALTLAEHWDKNVMQDRVSKTAKDHVADYVGQMQTTDPVRWAKREKRLGNRTGGDDDEGEPTKKRKRTSGVSTTAQTPSTGPTSTPRLTGGLHKTPGKRQAIRRPAADNDEDDDNNDEDDDNNDDDNDDEQNGPPAGGPGTDLPSIRHLLRDRPTSGPDTTRRQLFPSGPSGTDPASGLNPPSGAFGHRANPRPFATDNPYYQPPQREAPAAPGAHPDMQTIVREAVQKPMVADINGMDRDSVARNIGTRVRDEVASGIGTMVRDEVAGQMPGMVRDEVARQLPAVVRDEVARHFASLRRSDMEQHRQASANLLRPDLPNATHPSPFAAGRIPSPAHPQQQQQQQFAAFGRGGPYTSRPPPMGQFTQSPGPRAAPRGTTTRTPLPTAPGRFPMSHVRSRVRGRGGQTIEEEDEEEEEEDHRA